MSRFPTRPVAALSALALLAACSTPPNLAGTDTAPNRNRNTGLAIGAAAGALLGGPITGGGTERAAAGAVLGGAVGGLIGNDLDRQAAELRQELGSGITVENQGTQLLVSFPQDILFATDSASVASAQRQELADLAANLRRYPDTSVEIVGHTDNTGSAGHNFDLSTRRAGAVSAVLVDNGVPGGRIAASGRGEDAPIASNLTDDGRAQNRRVEVVITPVSA